MAVRVETRSIDIAAEAATVHTFMADPRNLPSWAPDFASGVRAAGSDWVVDRDGSELVVRFVVDEALGLVDIVSAADGRLRSFARVIGEVEGCQCLFTILFPEGTPEDAVAKQMATVDEELATVRALCESEPVE